jgi:hypothetical protein
MASELKKTELYLTAMPVQSDPNERISEKEKGRE